MKVLNKLLISCLILGGAALGVSSPASAAVRHIGEGTGRVSNYRKAANQMRPESVLRRNRSDDYVSDYRQDRNWEKTIANHLFPNQRVSARDLEEAIRFIAGRLDLDLPTGARDSKVGLYRFVEDHINIFMVYRDVMYRHILGGRGAAEDALQELSSIYYQWLEMQRQIRPV